MTTLDHHHEWMLAAEVAACLAEATRWDWSEAAIAAADTADELADAVYTSAEPEETRPIALRLSLLLSESATDWLATLGGDASDPRELRDTARKAFHTLRYQLFPNGPRSGRVF